MYESIPPTTSKSTSAENTEQTTEFVTRVAVRGLAILAEGTLDTGGNPTLDLGRSSLDEAVAGADTRAV